MKQSRYNYIFKNENGQDMAYNGITCSLAEIDKPFFDVLDKIKNNESLTDEERQICDLMQQCNYIIDDNIDEVFQLEQERHKDKNNKNILILSIAPTMQCNFKCEYCYENRKNGIMSDEIQDNIIKFIEKRKEGLEELNVSWFGGEPLMAKEVVWSLSKRMINFCEKNNIKYSANMVSNGALIDEITARNLEEYKIKTIQITLDGNEGIHNKKRKCLVGNGYRKIFNSIGLLLKTDIKVNIRINIDKTNINEIDDMLSDLKVLNDYKKLNIYFAQVSPYTDACKSIESSCVQDQDFSDIQIELNEKIEKMGFDYDWSKLYPKCRRCYCGAEVSNSFLVDQVGDLYKCWHDIGTVENSICNIVDANKDDNLILINKNFTKWIEHTPFIDNKCRECAFMPSCLGGCPYERVIKGTKGRCDRYKYNFEKIVKHMRDK